MTASAVAWSDAPELMWWIAARAGAPRGLPTGRGLAVFDGKRHLCAGAWFHDHHPEWRQIEMTAAGGKILSRRAVAMMAEYVYDIADVLILRTSPANMAVQRVAGRFSAPAYLPHLRGGPGELVYCITRDDLRRWADDAKAARAPRPQDNRSGADGN